MDGRSKRYVSLLVCVGWPCLPFLFCHQWPLSLLILIRMYTTKAPPAVTHTASSVAVLDNLCKLLLKNYSDTEILTAEM